MKRYLAITALLALVTVSPALAQTETTSDALKIKAGDYTLDPAHGKITWSVSHLGYSTYIGQFTDVAATLKIDPAAPERTLLNATVKTGSVGTLNETLDDHLKGSDFLNPDKFPTATFEATKVEVTGSKTARVTGNLTLLGVTRPEVMDVTFNQAGDNPISHKYQLGFSGISTIKRSDFGITKYLPMLGDDVSLQMEGEFQEGK